MAKLESLMPAMKLSCHLRNQHIFLIHAGYLKAYSLLMGVAGTEGKFSFFAQTKLFLEKEHLRQQVNGTQSS